MPPTLACTVPADCVVLPDARSVVQLRLYTNASPDAPHLFNTFDLVVQGTPLLQSPSGAAVVLALQTPSNSVWLHSVLVDGRGPDLAATNGATVVEQAAGPEWRYVALDLSLAYRDRLHRFTRKILFVEPDLLVLCDQLTAGEPVSFQTLLHPPAATRVDAQWGDLRLEVPEGGFRINTPGKKNQPRFWSRIESPADALLPGTATMQLGPTNKVAALDVLSVFAVPPPGRKTSYAFKLLESNNAVGARIHRQGFPTLVAFKTDPAAAHASLTGFAFDGPVGVSVFRPRE